jgi:aryl-alcohol dehydrogenase-like predicted oxidoreductase
MPSSLVLGTAQLGFPYGIANITGQPDLVLASEIIRTAWENGIREFDTAQDYGESEKALGAAFAKLGIPKKARVISKINPSIDHCDLQMMSGALDASLEKLGVPFLYGLMLHDENLLGQWTHGLGDILQSFIASGKVKNAGVSVYSPDKALEALHIDGINLLQIPSNILDRRFQKKGVFELAVRKKKKIYIRSVFLQGLILMEPDDLPDYMLFARPVLERIKYLAESLNITRNELALGYLRAKVPEAKLVIGVDTPAQISENMNYWKKKPLVNLISMVEQSFDFMDEKILNPSLWRS